MTSEELRLEAAQCLWEAAIDEGLYELATAPLFELREQVGAVELRFRLRNSELLDACSEGWHLAGGPDEFIGAYDWDYVPWFLAECVDKDARLRPDWKSRCKKFGASQRRAARKGARA